jgi:hypothetical protein
MGSFIECRKSIGTRRLKVRGVQENFVDLDVYAEVINEIHLALDI